MRLRDTIFKKKIFLLQKRISVGRKRRYARNIYNTEDKLDILKLNGFERFPSKWFTSTIVKRDFMRDEILPKQPVSAGVVH